MKEIQYVVLALTLICGHYSCGDATSVEENVEILSYSEFENNLVGKNSNLTLAKIKKVVSFESSSVTPLKVSDLYALSGHSIFIYSSGSRSILKFDDDGTFKGALGGYGKGPGEYIRPTQLISQGDKLYVLDNMAKKIHSYDLNDDSQLPPRNIRSAAYEFFVHGTDFIFYTPYKTSQYLFTELSGELEIDITIEKASCYETIDFYSGKKIYAYNNMVYFLDYLSGYVFIRPPYDNTAPRLKYKIMIEDQFPLSKCSSDIFNEPSEPAYRFPIEFVETDDHFVISFLDKGFNTNKILSDKTTKEFVVGDASLMEGSFINVLPFLPSNYHQDGAFSAMVNYDFLYNICGFTADRLPEELRSISEGDNPSLIIYELVSF